MPRAPAFQFYARDWLTDVNLSRCGMATRGFWMDCLAAMWLSGTRGELRDHTYEELARLCRCSPTEARVAVEELRVTETADVTLRDGVVTLRNRRMLRDDSRRKSSRSRQKRWRNAHVTPDVTGDFAGVTPPSASSSSCSHDSDPSKGLNHENIQAAGSASAAGGGGPRRGPKRPSAFDLLLRRGVNAVWLPDPGQPARLHYETGGAAVWWYGADGETVRMADPVAFLQFQLGHCAGRDGPGGDFTEFDPDELRAKLGYS